MFRFSEVRSRFPAPASRFGAVERVPRSRFAAVRARFRAVDRERLAYVAAGILLVLASVLAAEVANRLRAPAARAAMTTAPGKADRLEPSQPPLTFEQRWSGVYWVGLDTPSEKGSPRGILEDVATHWPPLPDDTVAPQADRLLPPSRHRNVCELHGLRKVYTGRYSWRCQRR